MSPIGLPSVNKVFTYLLTYLLTLSFKCSFSPCLHFILQKVQLLDANTCDDKRALSNLLSSKAPCVHVCFGNPGDTPRGTSFLVVVGPL